MPKFRFVKRKNLQKKDDPGKWYASPIVENRLNTGTVCRVVTRNTTTAPTELESGFNLVCDGIPLQLQLGNSVQLGKLGTLRLSFGSSGVNNIDAFNAATMIRNVKVIFTPLQRTDGRHQRRPLLRERRCGGQRLRLCHHPRLQRGTGRRLKFGRLG